MIRITDLKKQVSARFSLEIGALEIKPGERVALIGLNGSGKSTFLRLLAGQMQADSGKIELDVPRKRIGYQPQHPYVFRGTAEDNLRIALPRGTDVSALVSACGLEGLMKQKMSALSGGERQRVFLARMLAGNYPLMLLDEPLSAADLQTGAALSDVLRETCVSRGATLLFATHLPGQAFALATKILLFNDGKIAEAGAPDDLRSPSTEFGRRFFSQWNP